MITILTAYLLLTSTFCSSASEAPFTLFINGAEITDPKKLEFYIEIFPFLRPPNWKSSVSSDSETHSTAQSVEEALPAEHEIQPELETAGGFEREAMSGQLDSERHFSSKDQFMIAGKNLLERPVELQSNSGSEIEERLVENVEKELSHPVQAFVDKEKAPNLTIEQSEFVFPDSHRDAVSSDQLPLEDHSSESPIHLQPHSILDIEGELVNESISDLHIPEQIVEKQQALSVTQNNDSTNYVELESELEEEQLSIPVQPAIGDDDEKLQQIIEHSESDVPVSKRHSISERSRSQSAELYYQVSDEGAPGQRTLHTAQYSGDESMNDLEKNQNNDSTNYVEQESELEEEQLSIPEQAAIDDGDYEKLERKESDSPDSKRHSISESKCVPENLESHNEFILKESRSQSAELYNQVSNEVVLEQSLQYPAEESMSDLEMNPEPVIEKVKLSDLLQTFVQNEENLLESLSILSNLSENGNALLVLTQNVIDYITDQHNMYRSNIANGIIYGQPKASVMNEVVWSETIAKSSAIWASTCNFHRSPSDYYSGFEGHSNIGENLAVVTLCSDEGNILEKTFEFAVNYWFSEHKNYSFSTKQCNGYCGHYTQMVSDTTEQIGCAAAVCNDNNSSGKKSQKYFLVCHYGPGNNFMDQHPYETQPKDCPYDKPHRRKGLCSRIHTK